MSLTGTLSNMDILKQLDNLPRLVSRGNSARDLTGIRGVNGFVVLSPAASPMHLKEKRKVFWKCKCVCGNCFTRSAGPITNSIRNGVGLYCSHRCKSLPGTTRHGKGRASGAHPIYLVWKGMRARCLNKNNPGFKNYGGRGIRVCARWHTFENFWGDMHTSFRNGLTLERVNNSKGYSKANCKWATRKTQARNRRGLRYLETPKGTMLMVDAAKLFGLRIGTLWQRIARGNCPKDKLFDPVK